MPPAPVSWTLSARQQAHAIVSAVQPYASARGAWPLTPEQQRDSTTELLAGAFHNPMSPWRARPVRKLQHTFGVVGVHRLQITVDRYSGFLRRDSPSVAVGRWSLALDSAHPHFQPMVGLGLKLPVWQGPSVDLLAVSTYEVGDTVETVLASGVSTANRDPRTFVGPASEGRFELGGMLNRFERTLDVIGACPQVTAVRLPVGNLAMHDAWGTRSRPGVAPFAIDIVPTAQAMGAFAQRFRAGSGDDFTAWTPGEWAAWRVQLAEAPMAVVLARHTADADPEEIGKLWLDGELKPGPVGDRWLHFRHPMGDGACPVAR